MRVLVSGATGFVGRRVITEARRAGHDVVALVRPATPVAGLGVDEKDPGISIVRLDLRDRAAVSNRLPTALDKVDVVIHLAATKEGDFGRQFAATVVGTENLLAAMKNAGVNNLVGVSTFSVYDYQVLPSGSILTEDSPLEAKPSCRDEYTQTKLVQEVLFHEFGGSSATRRAVVVRPGMIYGPNNLWHALLGADVGSRFVRIGSKATLPLIYVDNAAEALVLAAEGVYGNSELDGQVLNLIDDDLPTQAAYVQKIAALRPVPDSITLPWMIVRAGASALQHFNDSMMDGRLRFPGIASTERLDARFKPLKYTNAKAKRLLGWQPRFTLDQALTASVDHENSENSKSAENDLADQPSVDDSALLVIG